MQPERAPYIQITGRNRAGEVGDSLGEVPFHCAYASFVAGPSLAVQGLLRLGNTGEMDDHPLGPARSHGRLDLGRELSAEDRFNRTETADE